MVTRYCSSGKFSPYIRAILSGLILAISTTNIARADKVDGVEIGDASNSQSSAASLRAVSQTVSGSVNSVDVYDYFKFTAAANGSLKLSLSGLTADLDLYLYDSSGSIVGSSTDIDLSSENISFNVTQGKTYAVSVDHYSGGTSSYQLTIVMPGQVVATPVTPSAPAISLDRLFAYAQANIPNIFKGSPVRGTYESFSYAYYASTNTYLAMDQSAVVYALGPATGFSLLNLGPVTNYSAAITSWENTSSPVAGTTSAPAPVYTARNINVGQDVSISSNDETFYAVQLSAGGLYSFNSGTPPTSAGADWKIYNASGTLQQIGRNSSSGQYLSWTPPNSGTYYVNVKGGSLLNIKSFGFASTNPYTSNLGPPIGSPVWFTSSLTYTFNGEVTS